MKLEFIVLGEPTGKGRPRFTNVGGKTFARTPEKTVVYENLIKLSYENQCGQYRINDDDNIKLSIFAYFSIPKSMTKKKRKLVEEGILRPTKKPDWDNIGKIVSDSLNQIAYKDDAQVVSVNFERFYGEKPYIKVILENI